MSVHSEIIKTSEFRNHHHVVIKHQEQNLLLNFAVYKVAFEAQVKDT